jgi:putative sporulation protein YtxC
MLMRQAEEVRVGTVENVDQVRNRLSFEFGFLAQQGFSVSVRENRHGDTTVFVCRLQPGRKVKEPAGFREMLRHHLANALSDLIVNEWEKSILNNLIKTQYECFNKGEQKAILSAASRNLNRRHDGRPDLLRKVDRKGRVLRLIIEYLNSQEDINLDGFITFRLRDYRDQLNDAVGQAVDEFLMEKEYLEFINLLRYFVESQESKLKLVHAVILPDGAFKLMDDKGATVTNEYLAESFVDIATDINTEDLFVSALITIAPERIILHCPTELDRLESLETVRSVFEGRVTTCRGCHLCRGERKATPVASHAASRKKRPSH